MQSVWEMIGTQLENARRKIQEEITHYPGPIPACDAHFNYMLEQRARIGEELNRMQLAAQKSLAAMDYMLIEEFMRSSDYLDDETRQQVRSRLSQDDR